MGALKQSRATVSPAAMRTIGLSWQWRSPSVVLFDRRHRLLWLRSRPWTS